MIRPLSWSLVNYGTKTYNTVNDAAGTRLFWLDFFRNIFAPYFGKQNGITRLRNFDMEQPVLLTNDLKLELPSDILTVLYYAKNPDVPMKFAVNVRAKIAMLVTIVMMIVIVVFASLFDDKLKFENII